MDADRERKKKESELWLKQIGANIAQMALWIEFQTVWNDFNRIFTSTGQIARGLVRGVAFKEISGHIFTRKKIDPGDIDKAAEELLESFTSSEDKYAETMVLPCLKALGCFVKFLKWEDKTRFQGFDDSWRDIYHTRNFKFKEQWTLVLRHMVDFV